MIRDLIIFFFEQDYMLYMLFVPSLGIAFFAGLISVVRGLSRGHR